MNIFNIFKKRKKRVLYQLNWTSGIGEFYANVCEILHSAKNAKEMGYTCELVFSPNGAHGVGNKYLSNVKIEQIFDMKIFNEYFDKITNNHEGAIAKKEYDGLECFFTSGAAFPGLHQWDAFKESNDDTHILCGPYKAWNVVRDRIFPDVYPEFIPEVKERSQKFLSKLNKNHNFIQFRVDDGNINLDNNEDKINKIYDVIKNSDKSYHLGSNSSYVYDKFSDLENVTYYEFKNLDEFNNDMNYFLNSHNIKENKEEKLYDRLLDNLAEIESIQYCDKIYHYSTFCWYSSFLTHPLVRRKDNFKFFDITNASNLETIE